MRVVTIRTGDVPVGNAVSAGMIPLPGPVSTHGPIQRMTVRLPEFSLEIHPGLTAVVAGQAETAVPPEKQGRDQAETILDSMRVVTIDAFPRGIRFQTGLRPGTRPDHAGIPLMRREFIILLPRVNPGSAPPRMALIAEGVVVPGPERGAWTRPSGSEEVTLVAGPARKIRVPQGPFQWIEMNRDLPGNGAAGRPIQYRDTEEQESQADPSPRSFGDRARSRSRICVDSLVHSNLSIL